MSVKWRMGIGRRSAKRARAKGNHEWTRMNTKREEEPNDMRGSTAAFQFVSIRVHSWLVRCGGLAFLFAGPAELDHCDEGEDQAEDPADRAGVAEIAGEKTGLV